MTNVENRVETGSEIRKAIISAKGVVFGV